MIKETTPKRHPCRRPFSLSSFGDDSTHESGKVVKYRIKATPQPQRVSIPVSAASDLAQGRIVPAEAKRNTRDVGIKAFSGIEHAALNLKSKVGGLPYSARLPIIYKATRQMFRSPLPWQKHVGDDTAPETVIARMLSLVREAFRDRWTPDGTYLWLDEAALAAAAPVLYDAEQRFARVCGDLMNAAASDHPVLGLLNDDTLMAQYAKARTVVVVASSLRSILDFPRGTK